VLSYLESDVPIEELVEAVQIDLIDAQVQLQVKTCQAIRHEDKMHLMYVSNKFNRKQVEVDLQEQLAQIQKDYYIQDKESYLGKMEAAGRKFPKINLKLDYPFNGPFEKRDGKDTRYKRVFVVEYAYDDKVQVETAVQLYKKSGRLSQHWGEHANIQIAPSKDPDITAATTVEKWHSICDSHSATMLSTGIVRLDGIKNPDVKVPIEYWKKSNRARADELSLRDVLHSIKVQGAEKDIQVFHGLCKSPDGGYEAACADTNPIAKTQARNVAAHTAGWVLGYVTGKGWKKECIRAFMKKAFNTSAVISAQKASWDKRTGQVTSDDLDEVDQELRNVTDSWVDMSLLTGGTDAAQDAALDSGDMAAFDWEAGASVRTMNSRGVESTSDTEGGSLVNSDEDEQSDEEEGEDTNEDQTPSEERRGEEEMSEDDAVEDDDGYWEMVSLAEWPIRELFSDNEEERNIIVEMLKTGDLPHWMVKKANDINDLVEEAAEIDEHILELFRDEAAGEDDLDFDGTREMYDFRLNEIECAKVELKEQLLNALKELLVREDDVDASAQTKHSVGFSAETTDGGSAQETFHDADMDSSETSKQDTAQDGSGREPG
jgi:hypothetical protein